MQVNKHVSTCRQVMNPLTDALGCAQKTGIYSSDTAI